MDGWKNKQTNKSRNLNRYLCKQQLFLSFTDWRGKKIIQFGVQVKMVIGFRFWLEPDGQNCPLSEIVLTAAPQFNPQITKPTSPYPNTTQYLNLAPK